MLGTTSSKDLQDSTRTWRRALRHQLSQQPNISLIYPYLWPIYHPVSMRRRNLFIDLWAPRDYKNPGRQPPAETSGWKMACTTSSTARFKSKVSSYFEAHGRFCASHPWEVIVSIVTLTVCALSMSVLNGGRVHTVCGFSKLCQPKPADEEVSGYVVA